MNLVNGLWAKEQVFWGRHSEYAQDNKQCKQTRAQIDPRFYLQNLCSSLM